MDLRLAILLVAALSTDGFAQATSALHSVRFGVSSVSAAYRDRTIDEFEDRLEHSGKIELKGTAVELSGLYENFELGIDYRTLTPGGTPYWSKRDELALKLAYYYATVPYVQPVIGYSQLTQKGDDEHAEAPGAFLDRNTALIFGLRSTLAPVLAFGAHGILIRGHMEYLTTLEAKQNFGTDGHLGLGYVYTEGRLRLGLSAGQTRNYYNATKEDEEHDGSFLHVRHTYVANGIGLFLQY